jgi:hypothetical protein
MDEFSKSSHARPLEQTLEMPESQAAISPVRSSDHDLMFGVGSAGKESGILSAC